MILKSPKGIYIQLESGKIISIKSGKTDANKENPLLSNTVGIVDQATKSSSSSNSSNSNSYNDTTIMRSTNFNNTPTNPIDNNRNASQFSATPDKMASQQSNTNSHPNHQTPTANYSSSAYQTESKSETKHYGNYQQNVPYNKYAEPVQNSHTNSHSNAHANQQTNQHSNSHANQHTNPHTNPHTNQHTNSHQHAAYPYTQTTSTNVEASKHGTNNNGKHTNAPIDNRNPSHGMYNQNSYNSNIDPYRNSAKTDVNRTNMYDSKPNQSSRESSNDSKYSTHYGHGQYNQMNMARQHVGAPMNERSTFIPPSSRDVGYGHNPPNVPKESISKAAPATNHNRAYYQPGRFS